MIAALIITTGKNPWKGGFEPEKEIGTISAIQRIAMIFQMAGVERVVVVCEEDNNQVEKLAAHMNLVFLHGQKSAEFLDNVKVGLSYLQDKCSAALISHVDVPLFSVETVHKLIATQEPVCIPSHRGSEGYPVLLRAEYFQAVLSYEGTGELPEALSASGLPPHMVSVEDEGILTDIQDADISSHLIAEHDLAELHFDLRIRLMKERAFYGPGTHQLLQLTEETGSLLEACRLMGISYSKGRKLISKTERYLGYAIIESQQGGKSGGRSNVTAQGKSLMAAYSGFYTEAKQCLHELFQKYFTP